MEPRLRTSPEQFSALIDFMESNGDLSRPQTGPQGRIRGEELWRELTSTLNSIGGGVNKSLDKWKKVWADWKTKTKRKYMLIRRHASGTGGGPSSRQRLTRLEERVIAVMGEAAVVGQAGVEEQGFSNATSQENIGEGSGSQFVLEIHTQATQPLEAQAPPPLAAQAPPPLAAQAPPPLAAQAPPPLAAQAPRSQAIPAQPQPSPSRHEARTSPGNQPASPLSTAASPYHRRLQLRTRRNRAQTPFDRAASAFVAVEQRRLQLEETRDRRLHEREMERLRLESERIRVASEHNQLLQQLGAIAERLIDTLIQHRPSSLPSTVILPD